MEMVNVGDAARDSSNNRRVSRTRWLAHLFVCTAVASLSTFALPDSANAATPCSGQVCLFDSTGAFIGGYTDVTNSWQSFNTARAASAFDGFSDNAVYFKYSNGPTSCIQPQREASVQVAAYGNVTGLMIRPGGNCYPNGQIQ
jgi:hypothetical protein